MMRHTRHAIVLVALFMVIGTPPVTTAQSAPPPPGVCEGFVCGPSMGLHPLSFPTLTPINWDYGAALPHLVLRDDLIFDPHALYVATDGDDDNPGTREAPFATVDRALAVAAQEVGATVQDTPGVIIWVADGVYEIGAQYDYEALRIDRPKVGLVAEHIGGATLVPAYPDDAAIGIQASGDFVLIEGFVISGFREAGIEFGNVAQPQHIFRLQHLIVEGSAEGIRAVYGGDGVQPVIDGMLIYDVWLRDITLIGLQCGEGPCNNLRWEGLRVDMSASGDDTGADGIAVESGENIVIFSAEVSGASGDGIDLKTATGVVANVIVQDVQRNGIKLWHGGDIINALVYNTGADAAIVFEAGDFRILNTIVARHAYGDSAYALTAGYDTPDQPGRVEIINSVFYENSGAVWVSPSLDLWVANTLFVGSGNGEDLTWGDITTGPNGSPISALEAAGVGAGNLDAADPLFVDPAGGNYLWDAASPLRDAGTDSAPLPEFDLYGLPRVDGDAVDLGPVEYHTTLTP